MLVGGAFLLSAACLPAATACAAPVAPAASGRRARYHFTVPDHWKNDPQRPVLVDGVWHYYYLYNADYDREVGTAWRLATTTDFVHFHDQGVAAPKKTNANFDLWSGSAVVDVDNTAGFGAGAVVMLATQMDHPTPEQIRDATGPQAQFLWFSVDGGRTFRAHTEHAVMPNGGRRDFRDPKIVRDTERNRWVAVITEGEQVGFWVSNDLKVWKRVSGFVRHGIGVLECPDLFRLRADDGTLTWVLGVSANGPYNTYAYWTGSFDGTTFTPDAAEPQWLDHGFDWYGAVTWEDPARPLEVRHAIGWMNNWAYPYTTPTWSEEGFNGTDSIVREVRCRRLGGRLSLVSRPLAALDSIVTRTDRLGSIAVSGRHDLGRRGVAYRLECDVSWPAGVGNVGVQVRVSDDGTRHADVGVCGDYSYVNRASTGHPSGDGSKLESRAPFDRARRTAQLTVLVDTTTVEVFVDEGRVVHSSQVFADPADVGLALYAVGGTATFSNIVWSELATVVQRPARVIADFEGDRLPVGWTASGGLAGVVPTASDLAGQQGRRVLDTYAGSDAVTGIVTSPPFLLDRTHLHFLLGGGRHPLGEEPATSVQLLVDGRPVRTATGRNDATLRHEVWDLADLQGRWAQFQVLDDAPGAWGHLMVDHIVLSDGGR